MRAIFFTGKGGAGVSTLVAATAVAIALGGRRIMAFGVGPGLARAFDCALGDQPRRLSDRLWAMEAAGSRAGRPGPVLAWLRDLFRWRSVDEAMVDDVAALPGFVDLARLVSLHEQIEGGKFDTVVVDGPALRHALDLLGALDASARALERLLPVREPTVLDPFLKALSGYSSDGEEVYGQGRSLLARLAGLRSVLAEAESASTRIIVPPQRGAVEEAQRAVAALSLFAYPLDAAFCNRVLPPDAGAWARQRRQDQLAAVEQVTRALAPMPVMSVPLQRTDAVGLDALSDLAALAYGDRDPAAVMHREPKQGFAHQDGVYVLTVVLPFARREDLAIERLDDAVVVRVGELTRTYDLPEEAVSMERVASTFDGETLRVTFS